MRTVRGWARFRILEVPPTRYLMVDGHGDPNTSPEFAHAVAALYPLAYKLKFASKARGRDYVVMPLEGLWTADDMATFTTARDKSRWDWTLAIMVPDWTTAEDFAAAAVDEQQVRLETLDEGLCVQNAPRGSSYDDEAPALARLRDEFIPAEGLHDDRSPPRDLSERSPQGRPREAAHHPASTGSAHLRRVRLGA